MAMTFVLVNQKELLYFYKITKKKNIKLKCEFISHKLSSFHTKKVNLVQKIKIILDRFIFEKNACLSKGDIA